MRHRINRRMANSPSRIMAYDRRLAAIHEAGHALMGLHLGFDVDAWIHPRKTDRPLDEKTWRGHVTIRNMPEDTSDPRIRAIALAGMVAETLWKCGHDEDRIEPYGWEDLLLDEDSMSFSDWRLAGCEPGEPDDDLYELAAEVAGLFMGDLWPVLTNLSRTLMTDIGEVHSFTNAAARIQQAA